ncbi:Uncharacterised protein [Legionella donaldsonii]|uniref:Transmembrane protein n=1 Tax=Legionella donaldsonii TaxID=45060 RepID=A0A378J055_9GAMM|nr:hypothetical protein [Legionella donaldsonii]STX41124.1 Uncharacterised protein [Legionella donaldsonii]
MNSQELRSAIQDDIRNIKNISPDIIPGRVYYGQLAKLGFGFYWKILLIVSLALTYSFNYNSDYLRPPLPTILDSAFSALIIGSIASLIMTFLLINPLNMLVLFRFHLEKKLKTGGLLIKKFKLIGIVYLSVLTFFCLLFGFFAKPEVMIGMLLFAFVLSGLATSFFIKLELNRIGLSTVYDVINEFVNKSNHL